MKVVFLVSGGGGHLRYFLQSIKVLGLPIKVCGVVADRLCGAYHFAMKANVPAFLINYSTASPHLLRQKLKELQPDLVITNIHKIIDAETLSAFSGKMINLHYSLLPAFGGLVGMKTVEAAKQLNVQFIGSTCHQVIEKVDAGVVIGQSCFAVNWQMPMGEIGEIMFRSACLVLLNGAVSFLADSSNNAVSAFSICNRQVHFSPPLAFNVERLATQLWPNIS